MTCVLHHIGTNTPPIPFDTIGEAKRHVAFTGAKIKWENNPDYCEGMTRTERKSLDNTGEYPASYWQILKD